MARLVLHPIGGPVELRRDAACVVAEAVPVAAAADTGNRAFPILAGCSFGQPALACDDGPMTPWFMRRNMIRLVLR